MIIMCDIVAYIVHMDIAEMHEHQKCLYYSDISFDTVVYIKSVLILFVIGKQLD